MKVVTLDQLNALKEFKVDIGLDSTVFHYGENIEIKLTVKNECKNTVRFLFANPNNSFGPWATSATLVDLNSKKSKLKYPSKAVLQSQIYFEEDLVNYYRYLKHGESISGTFNLMDIVILVDEDQILSKGKYELQLFFHSIASNKLLFTVE
ncbi:MAG: hypothetical protein Crog4KO_25280 [Crocinitomicaceae bacterium]